ncbi:MAG: hypothetical protein BMS9Abin28_2178 [Anaerolineae bacterium]|nr:MAG: hypothetical protein BMS9Abin28_2178 [Anaerolineae bacterium]
MQSRIRRWSKSFSRATGARVIAASKARLQAPSAVRPEQAIVVGFVSLYLIVLIRTAWVSDDAYITYRTISNLAADKGLVWNVGERVQAYTHPLWMFLIAAGVFFTREFYFTSLAISIAVSIAAALAFWRWIASTPMMAVFGLSVLVLSKAYVDYSTSGLENALSHLLLVAFLAIYFGAQRGKWKLASLAFVTALLGANRLDLLLLVLPALAYETWRSRNDKPLRYVALGLTPLIAWEVFSIVYYGFPFPNTAYAKLTTGLQVGDLVEQGLFYLLNSAAADPLTLVFIVAGVGMAIYLRRPATIALAGGVLLYLFYIVRIGGGFMSGRFLTAPLVLSVGMISQIRLPDRWALVGVVLVVAAGLAAPSPVLTSGESFGEGLGQFTDVRGIADNRAYLYQETGLLQASRYTELPNHPWVTEGIAAREGGPSVLIRKVIGFFGFYAGREVHIVDPWGLSDALLARLPPVPDPFWRIGHFERRVPDGYIESLETGENRIENPDLAEFYEALTKVIRGPLFAKDRWVEIWRLNTGAYDANLQAYVDSLPLSVPLARVTPGEPSNPVRYPPDGLRVQMDEARHSRRIKLRLERPTAFQVLFTLEGREIARKLISAENPYSGGMSEVTLGLSAAAARKGYDTLTIYPARADSPLELEIVEIIDE